MAPSPAAYRNPRTDERAEVTGSAAAVFGALDLLEEMATAPATRAHTRTARKGAEAALAECGLTHEDLRVPNAWPPPWEGCHSRRPEHETSAARSDDLPVGEVLPFAPRAPTPDTSGGS